jgi:parallel beta-helix repeat protein
MNNCGLIVYGNSLSDYINDVDTSNKVNEKVIYYLLNENGFTIPNNAGQVILINCDYCIVSNLELCNGTVGVELAYSDLNKITKNTLKNNKYSGVYIETSQENKVESNTIENNSYGISMQLAYKNDIKNNKIQTDYYGCYISFSNNNNFSGNNIIYNNYGIYFNLPSASNIIHQNNLYYNGLNAYDENQKTNVWDDGKKGNYWGDYKTKYPNARRIWLKGIWNIPYEIPSKDNRDRFPLIFPYVFSIEKKGNFKLTNLLSKIFDNNMILKSIYEIKNLI